MIISPQFAPIWCSKWETELPDFSMQEFFYLSCTIREIFMPILACMLHQGKILYQVCLAVQQGRPFKYASDVGIKIPHVYYDIACSIKGEILCQGN